MKALRQISLWISHLSARYLRENVVKAFELPQTEQQKTHWGRSPLQRDGAGLASPSVLPLKGSP